MARNSQQRRAHRQRQEEQRRRLQDRRSSGPRERLDDRSIQELILHVARVGDDAALKHRFECEAAALAALDSAPESRGRVTAELSGMLAGIVRNLFGGGWQPADLVHFVKRRRTARAHRLAVALVAAHARDVGAAERAPERWLSQLVAMGALDPSTGAIRGGQADVVERWARTERLHPDEALTIALQTMASLLNAPPLPVWLDPPSTWTMSNRGSAPTRRPQVGEVDAKALATIRALLAKAESTDFDAEAEAFTTKAQQLMTRHSIDAAMLASSQRGGEGPMHGIESRRVHIDNPYADEKAQMLSIIGEVNGARAVWHPNVGFVALMGFEVDLHLTDVLFTSLLVQATRASAEATAADVHARNASFKRAFLLSYAVRIGERLRAAKQATSASAVVDYGDALVPVLAARQHAVDEAFARTYPDLRPGRARRVDAAGYHAGRAAADRAQIGLGRPITRGGL